MDVTHGCVGKVKRTFEEAKTLQVSPSREGLDPFLMLTKSAEPTQDSLSFHEVKSAN